jgi:hypothetical protein
MDWTLTAAITGAITGPISLGWTMYVHWSGRPRLKVEGEVTGEIVMGDGLVEVSRTHWLNLRVTNIGRSPIVLSRISRMHGDERLTWRDRLGLPKKNKGVFSYYEPGMPRQLDPGHFYSERLTLDESYESFFTFHAITSTDEVYTCSIENRRQMKLQIAREIEHLRSKRLAKNPEAKA